MRWLALILFGMLIAVTAPAGQASGKPEGEDQPSRADLSTASLEDLMNVKVEEVYSASKYMQKVTEAPTSVSIVSSDDIRKYGYRTLADILQGVRGCYVTYDRNYSYVGTRDCYGRAITIPASFCW